jgi:hypothetical protein
VIEPAQTTEFRDIEGPFETMGNIDATQQWREGVEQNDQYEEDTVCSQPVFIDYVSVS